MKRRSPHHHVAAITTLAALACQVVMTAGASEQGEMDVPGPFEVCLSCHTIRPDEPLLVGPTLWGVMGRPIASVPGFEYSAALRGQQGRWDRQRLDRFLTAPQQFAPGTAMTLGGVHSAADRKQVLDFLESLDASHQRSTASDEAEEREDDD